MPHHHLAHELGFGCAHIGQGLAGLGCGLKMTKYTVRLSVDLGSRGTVNMMTLPAMTVDELRKKLKELGKKPSR